MYDYDIFIIIFETTDSNSLKILRGRLLQCGVNGIIL